MDEFQMEVVQRLTKIEAKLDNGLVGELRELKSWTKEWMEVHPSKCPLVERKTGIVHPVIVGVIVGGVVLVADVVVKLVMG